jgi:membrane-bound serine protease (ClpP class)
MVGAIALIGCAQLPGAFGEEPDEAPAKDQKHDEKKEPEEEPAKKNYKKPEPKPLPEGPAETLSGPIAVVRFKGMVNPGMGEFTVASIDRAEREHAQAVLIELDTPGGLVSTTQTIVQAILASKVPVIVFVAPSGAHAASAGTWITLAAHVAAMAHATRIGAAHPVTGSGKDPEAEGGKHMGRKIENDLTAWIEGVAAERGRNVEWAIDAVRRSESITAQRALEIGVIDLVAADRAELLEAIDGRELMLGKHKVKLATKSAPVVEYELTLRQQLVSLLANPGIAILLGILGLIGIMIEIYHPGVIAPGVMGVLCIICSMIAIEQLPIDVGGAILVVAGIGLLVAELFMPTYGALGILGGIGLAIGLLLLIDPSHPGFAIDKDFGLTWKEVLPAVGLLGLSVLYISVVVVRSRGQKPVTGREALLGSVGFVLKPVDKNDGMVFVQGEYWKARAPEPIQEKEEVEVTGMDGLVLEVRRKRPRP